MLALAAALTPVLGLAAEQSVAVTASEPLVVVMSNNPDAPFVRRLAAELSLFGYRVSVATRTAEDAETTPDQQLTRSGAAALIAVDQGRQTVDIVVAGSPGGPPRHERERLDPRRRADTNAAVLAERFRARLTELGIAPGAAASFSELAAPEPEYQPSPATAAATQRRLWLAGAFGGTSGGLGLVPDAQVELRVFPVLWLSTSAFAKLSLLPAEVSAREGESDVRLQSGGVLIDVYPLRGDFVLKTGLGAMLVNAQMTGRAAGSWLSAEDSVLVPAGLFDLGAGLRLSSRVSVEVSSFVGVCAPRIGVSFAQRSVAHYGRPFVGASLGLAVGVF